MNNKTNDLALAHESQAKLTENATRVLPAAPLFASNDVYWTNLARSARYEAEKAKLTNDYFEDFINDNPQYLKKKYQDQQ